MIGNKKSSSFTTISSLCGIRPVARKYSLISPTLHYNVIDSICTVFNTLRPRQNGRHFADSIFECIFLNENVWMVIQISLKFVPQVLINSIVVFVQMMAWRRPGDKPLSEPIMVRLVTHICVTGPHYVQWHFITINTKINHGQNRGGLSSVLS